MSAACRMLVFGSTRETIPRAIGSDASSGLPLLSGADLVVQYIAAYLALPYSATEFGCSEKV